ncbi:MAG: peptidase M16 [Rhodospirillaceae bacterium]|nr:MAG: peptidase M16 [Rhodospirillaceae bacterium]
MRALGFIIVLLASFSANAVTVERVISAQGIEAWLVQDHANPLVSMQFSFAGGSELDPLGKSGLAHLASTTMDEGAGDLDSQTFQSRLTDQSIKLRFSAGRDGFSGTFKTLKKHEDEAFDLLRLALTEPRFDDEPVARLKSQIQSGLKSDLEKPNAVASIALFKSLFGDHAYARRSKGTVESLDAIKRADLLNFVKTRIARRDLKIGVVGDITPKRLGELLDRTFAGLPLNPGPAKIRPVKAKATGRVVVVEKDLVQSTIMFGHGGVKRDDPDFYIALVMNHILGGGSFTSRLYAEVREKRGLAYSVGTSIYPLKSSSLLVGSAGTENARVSETLDIVRAEWKRMQQGDISQQEIDDAKTYLTGSFPLRFTSTSSIAGVLVAMQVNTLGLDYLDRRSGYIGKITLKDVQRVAKRLLKADLLDIVVVGKPEGIVSNP